jgi:hypothetical protein
MPPPPLRDISITPVLYGILSSSISDSDVGPDWDTVIGRVLAKEEGLHGEASKAFAHGHEIGASHAVKLFLQNLRGRGWFQSIPQVHFDDIFDNIFRVYWDIFVKLDSTRISHDRAQEVWKKEYTRHIDWSKGRLERCLNVN